MSSNPSELKYTATHEWASESDGVWTVGLTEFASEQLGDLVYINLPQVGDAVTAGEIFADVESVKAVSDVYSPVTGTICEVNEELIDAPQRVNESAFDAWIIRVEDVEDTVELLDEAAYEAVCEKER